MAVNANLSGINTGGKEKSEGNKTVINVWMDVEVEERKGGGLRDGTVF